MSTLASVVLRDTLVNRPAAGIAGRLFYDTTNSILQRDNGSSWDNVGESSAGGGGEFTELGKATLNAGNLTTTSTTFVDATGLSVTLTTAAVRCIVTFSAVATNSVAGQVDVDLDIDGTRVYAGNAHGFKFFGASAANQHGDISIPFYMTDVLTAAAHTFKIVWRTTIGTGTLYGNTTHSPAILTVLETSMAA